jgi:hypothetical protein
MPNGERERESERARERESERARDCVRPGTVPVPCRLVCPSYPPSPTRSTVCLQNTVLIISCTLASMLTKSWTQPSKPAPKRTSTAPQTRPHIYTHIITPSSPLPPPPTHTHTHARVPWRPWGRAWTDRSRTVSARRTH